MAKELFQRKLMFPSMFISILANTGSVLTVFEHISYTWKAHPAI